MRIELRDQYRRRLGRITVDPAQRPTRVVIHRGKRGERGEQNEEIPHRALGVLRGEPAHAAREAFLNWDSALDDAGQLRKCVSCGCGDLFNDRAFPQITGLVVTLAFIGAIIGALGLVNTPVLIAMAGVLVLDVAILVFARRRLVCYQCRTSYHELPIARYHRRWDRAVADRYPALVPPRLTTESTEEGGLVMEVKR